MHDKDTYLGNGVRKPSPLNCTSICEPPPTTQKERPRPSIHPSRFTAKRTRQSLEQPQTQRKLTDAQVVLPQQLNGNEGRQRRVLDVVLATQLHPRREVLLVGGFDGMFERHLRDIRARNKCRQGKVVKHATQNAASAGVMQRRFTALLQQLLLLRLLRLLQ